MKQSAKQIAIASLLACIMMSAISCVKTETIPLEVLKDKIKGGWAGQTIGCTFGGPTEFRYKGCMIPDSIEIAWPDHQVKNYFDHGPGLYDDIYMDLTFVDVFQRLGLEAPTDSFAYAFANAGYTLWHANQQARYNILHGIMPPQSGYWKNNVHADDIDFQIESDYAGLMSPAMPEAAAHFADGIGHIMNYGDGWYGGVYVATMYSLAFISDDINFIVTEALKAIPSQSRYYRCISDVIRWHAEVPDNWKYCWQKCQENYGKSIGCTEGATLRGFNIDAVINSAYIVIGLLYGEGDFGKTMELSTRCGQDSDCNPASAGGILGTVLGYRNIPDRWKSQLAECEDRNFAYTSISLNRAYEYSFEQAKKVIEKYNGTVRDGKALIKYHKPKPVRLEQCFEGFSANEVVSIAKNMDELEGPIEFDGSAFLLCGWIYGSGADPDHVAKLKITVDQKEYIVELPANYRYRRDHILAVYDLEDGHHRISIEYLNMEQGRNIRISDLVLYR